MNAQRAKRPVRQRQQEIADFQAEAHYDPRFNKGSTAPLEGKTPNQKRYLNAMQNFKLVFATGPAGVGKTFMCGTHAADLLRSQEIGRIVITRPAVEADESLGFLPGEIEDKFDPYLQPFKEVLERRLGKSQVAYMIKSGQIVASPLAYMRGSTFNDAFVILDEAQNTTPRQMKMFLTRIGQNCHVVVNGDMSQCDLRGPSGLEDAVRRVTHIPDVTHVTFDRRDIVRSGLVAEIVQAYDQDLKELDANK